PTGDLDSQTGKVVIDLIRRFSKEKNTAVIIVTHDIAMAKTCDRMIQIGDGKVISD
ncbi:MAG: ABC transporter ATP-binding protein, partial [Candidatus Heimdallarchaeota archaeon]|nr:ABC transporter ATP-binding protein [Candidatus Heimdallarchaeota archaeon]